MESEGCRAVISARKLATCNVMVNAENRKTDKQTEKSSQEQTLTKVYCTDFTQTQTQTKKQNFFKAIVRAKMYIHFFRKFDGFGRQARKGRWTMNGAVTSLFEMQHG